MEPIDVSLPGGLKVVYVAGPFRAADPWGVHLHVVAAMAAALSVWRAGGVALCPHANTWLFDKVEGLDDRVWLAGDLELMRRCDAVYTVGDWQGSTGASREVEVARSLNLPVFHTLRALTAWLKKGRE